MEWTTRGGSWTTTNGVELPGTYWAQGNALVTGRLEGGVRTLHVVNCGGGRQSSWYVVLACLRRVPLPDVVIMSDTGDERPETMAYWWDVLVPLMETAGIPWRLVGRLHTHESQAGERGDIRKDTLASVRDGLRIANAPLYTKGSGKPRKRDGVRPNGQTNRSCTSEYKIDPIMKCIRHLLGMVPGQRWISKMHGTRAAVQVIGIAAEEAKRAKGKGSGQGSVLVYPLVEDGITTDDCIDGLLGVGLPEPVKSACRACPYRSNASWARLKRDDPESFASAVEFDERLRHPHGMGRLNDGYTEADYLQGREPEGKVKGLTFPAYVHPSCVPLKEIAWPDPGDDESESFGGEC